MAYNTLTGLRSASEAAATSFWDGTAGALDTNGMPRLTRAYYMKTFLAVAEGERLHARWGQQTTLPQGNGNTVMWRRYLKLTAATTPLTEGVTPTGSNLAYEQVLGTVKQYGDWVGITDIVTYLHPDNTLAQVTKALARQAADTEEVIIRDIINAGASFLRCSVDGTGTMAVVLTARSNTAASLHKRALDTAITMLEGADAKYIHGQMDASTKVGTSPLAPSYICIIHPHVAHDLQSVNIAAGTGAPSGMNTGDFIPRQKYASGGVAYPTEIGTYRNVRFVTSTFAKVWADAATGISTGGTTAAATFRATTATNPDVYSCLLIAKDAYGVIKLAGSSGTYYDAPGGQGDPIHQRSTAAWKRMMGAAILNDDNMVRIECTARW
jgi:N4-gp56 family major capsid protein